MNAGPRTKRPWSRKIDRPPAASAYRDPVLLVILVVSLALKLALVVPAHWLPAFNDSLSYISTATRLARNGSYWTGRSPGYPAFLAVHFRVAEAVGLPMIPPKPAKIVSSQWTGLDLARLTQVALSVLGTYWLYLLSARFFDRRTSLGAAAAFAFFPQLVGFSHYLWSETLFLTLMLGGLLLADGSARRQSKLHALACGLLLGVASLTRQVGLVVVVVSAAWIWIRIAQPIQLRDWVRGESIRTATVLALIVGLTSAATILPWTARNYVRHQEFVLISASGGIGLLFGAIDHPMPEIAKLVTPENRLDRVAVDNLARERALGIIGEDPTGWLRRCLTHNIPSLFQPILDGVTSHILGKYPYTPLWLMRAVLVLLLVSYAVLSVAGIAGIWLAGAGQYRWLTVAMIVSIIATHTTILGVTRHRLPIEVLLMPFAAFALTRTRDELRAAWSPHRAIGILLTLACFAGVVSLSRTDRIQMNWRKATVTAERVGSHP